MGAILDSILDSKVLISSYTKVVSLVSIYLLVVVARVSVIDGTESGPNQ